MPGATRTTGRTAKSGNKTRNNRSARQGSSSKRSAAPSALNAKRIAEEAKVELTRPSLKRFKFRVFVERAWLQGNHWFVPIESGRSDLSAYDYAKHLNRIEDKFEKRGINVTLFPAAGLIDVGR